MKHILDMIAYYKDLQDITTDSRLIKHYNYKICMYNRELKEYLTVLKSV